VDGHVVVVGLGQVSLSVHLALKGLGGGVVAVERILRTTCVSPGEAASR
jgi:hypothetical protein